MESKNRKLRSGYTTGACAAAAAKAATALLMRNAECGVRNEDNPQSVEIPFPDGSRVSFKVHRSEFTVKNGEPVATASIIKDAGDDPDVTNGAEIVAEAGFNAEYGMPNAELKVPEIVILGGRGVGRVTKPGLAIPVGEPAINPVPRRMIREAVREAVSEFRFKSSGALLGISHSEFRIPNLEVTVSVPQGEELAKKTLNNRLGIVGGLSILGTTGIVKPVSTEAYTASITSAMDVAKATGNTVVVLSSGRTSEKAHMKKFSLPEEAYVMMGDYLEFALLDAKKHGFSAVHLCAQWAKMVKTAMGTPQTHVRHGAIEVGDAAAFLRTLGIDIPVSLQFNTVREAYEHLNSALRNPHSAFEMVCTAAKRYAEGITSGIPVTVHLVSYEGDILASSE